MEAVPQHQRAIVGLATGKLGIADTAPVPALEDDMVLVRTTAVALNPVDNKMQGRLATGGAIAGHDFAGVVAALGSQAGDLTPAATTTTLRVGDRVCSAVQGMHASTPAVGAFASYVGATAHACLRIPKAMSDEQGASLGTAVATMGLALFRSLAIPGHPEKPVETGSKGSDILIYGGSSSVGTMAIQLAKL